MITGRLRVVERGRVADVGNSGRRFSLGQSGNVSVFVAMTMPFLMLLVSTLIIDLGTKLRDRDMVQVMADAGASAAAGKAYDVAEAEIRNVAVTRLQEKIDEANQRIADIDALLPGARIQAVNVIDSVTFFSWNIAAPPGSGDHVADVLSPACHAQSLGGGCGSDTSAGNQSSLISLLNPSGESAFFSALGQFGGDGWGRSRVGQIRWAASVYFDVVNDRERWVAIRDENIRALNELTTADGLESSRVLTTVMHLNQGSLSPGPDNYDGWVTLADVPRILGMAHWEGSREGDSYARMNAPDLSRYTTGAYAGTHVEYATGISGSAVVTGAGVTRESVADLRP